MCDSHYYVYERRGRCLRTNGGIIPKCFDDLDSETIHLYNVKKKILMKGIVVIITKCSWKCSSKIKYPFALQECLSLNCAQQQYENTNTSKKELKLTKTFSVPSFGKFKIKLSNISDPVIKNLSIKLRIVGFQGARATLKCSLNFCWVSLIDLVLA